MECVIGTVTTIVQTIVNNLDSDNESSSDDEEDLVEFFGVFFSREHLERRPRIQNYVENVVAYLSDEGFKEHFRMSRETFQYLLELITPQLERQGQGSGRNPISPEKQVLLTIWTLATPDSYRSICDRFDVGKATAWRSVRRVINAVVSLRNRFIKWPNAEEAAISARVFSEKAGFPGVIGAVDGTHIVIDAPKENAQSYVDRKWKHSIQLQVVCDHNLKFIDCFVGYPGSVHDQRVFTKSGVQDFCRDPTRFPNDTHLIGDAAYKNEPRIIVPYKDNGRLSEMQKNFNYCLSSTRMTVERSIGLLKGRFRILLDRLPMRRIDLMPNYIMACCVLHNICITLHDLIEIPLIADTFVPIPLRDEVTNARLTAEGREKRDRIKDMLRMRIPHRQ